MTTAREDAEGAADAARKDAMQRATKPSQTRLRRAAATWRRPDSSHSAPGPSRGCSMRVCSARRKSRAAEATPDVDACMATPHTTSSPARSSDVWTVADSSAKRTAVALTAHLSSSSASRMAPVIELDKRKKLSKHRYAWMPAPAGRKCAGSQKRRRKMPTAASSGSVERDDSAFHRQSASHAKNASDSSLDAAPSTNAAHRAVTSSSVSCSALSRRNWP